MMKAYISRVTLGVTVGVIISGCSVVKQPVYPAYKTQNGSPVINKDADEMDGVPYVLPRNRVKLTIPVVVKSKVEGGYLSEAREVFKKIHLCRWEKDDAWASRNNIDAECNDAAFENEVLRGESCLKDVADVATGLGIGVDVEEYKNATINTYKIGDVVANLEAEPDPQQIYVVKLTGGRFEKRNIDISFGPGGILNEVSLSAEDKKSEFITRTIGGLLTTATKLAGVSIDDGVAGRAQSCSAHSKYTGLYLRAKSVLKFIQGFEDFRITQIDGANNTSMPKETLELRLKELDGRFEAAKAFFEGATKTEVKNFEVTLLPNQLDSKIQFGSFSATCGLVLNTTDDQVVSSSLTTPKECDSTTLKNLVASFTSPSYLGGKDVTSVFANLPVKENEVRGIYYRVPKTVRMSLMQADKRLLERDVQIAQFGIVKSLPASTGSPNVNYKVTLEPSTGMLLKVSVVSESASTSAAKDLIDPLGDYLKARKAGNDELTVLQREEALLKVQKSIKDLKASLGGGDTP